LPERKRRIPFQGREVEATLVSPTQSAEHWNTYLLEDGSVIKLKAVATEFMRVDGMYDAEGNPVYAIKSATVTTVDAAEDLKKKA
jgi:hypothetical protein